MAFIKLKLDDHHQSAADDAYSNEKMALGFIDSLESVFGAVRWFSVGKTHIEQGFMALRKGITEKYEETRLK